MKITIVKRPRNYLVKQTIAKNILLRELYDRSDAIDDDDLENQKSDELSKVNESLWGLYHACQDFDFARNKSMKIKSRIDILRQNTLSALGDMNNLEEECSCGRDCKDCQYFDYCDQAKKENCNAKN